MTIAGELEWAALTTKWMRRLERAFVSSRTSGKNLDEKRSASSRPVILIIRTLIQGWIGSREVIRLHTTSQQDCALSTILITLSLEEANQLQTIILKDAGTLSFFVPNGYAKIDFELQNLAHLEWIACEVCVIKRVTIGRIKYIQNQYFTGLF